MDAKMIIALDKIEDYPRFYDKIQMPVIAEPSGKHINIHMYMVLTACGLTLIIWSNAHCIEVPYYSIPHIDQVS